MSRDVFAPRYLDVQSLEAGDVATDFGSGNAGGCARKEAPQEVDLEVRAV
jgi:hypothetical protein